MIAPDHLLHRDDRHAINDGHEAITSSASQPMDQQIDFVDQSCLERQSRYYRWASYTSFGDKYN
jgi:hypothetical protein